MKRFLSILLVLATLLCLFPFAVSAEGEGADTGDKSAATYLDLYVKDGLVALFDAYSATASETAALSWTPVDLYGKAGYDDYLAPKEYFFAGSGTQESQFTWRYVDGALAPFVSNAGVSTPTYLQLGGEDGLSADILNGTVQEVFAPATVNRVLPTVTDGFLNSAELPAFGTECQAAFGAYSFGGMLRLRGNPAFEGDPGKMINLFCEFPTFDGASIGCLYYSGEKFGTMSYPSLKGVSPTSGKELVLDNYSIGMPIVVERTVIRTVENKDGTYTSTYGLHYAAVPTYVGQKVNSGTFPALVYTSSSDNAALHTKTTLRLAADTAPVYSIRVYNKALSAEEVARNHMADLVAFYGVSADKVLALSEETLLGFIELCAAYEMTPDGKSDEEGSAYMTVKGALEAYLPEESAVTYIDLYVKDGLVALFDAYSAKASETAVLGWTPVDLYGKDGYNDYLAPKEYSFADSGTQESQFTWRYVDGAIAPFVSNPVITLPTYLELSGENGLSADILNGTVQEVFAPATVNRVKPTVVNGFLNSAELPAFGTECQAAFGAYSFGGILRLRGNPAYEGDPGKMINLFCEYPTFNGASTGALFYNGEKFGTMSYPSLKGLSPTSGKELVLDNYSIGMPIVVERTVIRTVENKDGTYTSTYGLHYAATPIYAGEKMSYGTFPALVYTTSSDNAALHTKTTLRLAADTAPVYSIRVYNKALSADEVARNHMADLVAFYGVSADKVLALSARDLSDFIELCAAYELTPDGKSDREDSAYMTVKGALEAYLDAGEERLEECVKQLLTFAGIRYRVTGQYGIRTIFAVDKEAVLSLEESGYTVVYGALMAVKEKGDTQYNASAEDLTVRIGEDGKVELATGNAAVLVSSDNGLKYLSGEENAFAFTTLYDPGHAKDEDSIYDAKMLYRGFVAVIDGEGVARVLYDDLAMENDALNAPSLREVHQYALDNTPDLPEELSNRLKFLDE